MMVKMINIHLSFMSISVTIS